MREWAIFERKNWGYVRKKIEETNKYGKFEYLLGWVEKGGVFANPNEHAIVIKYGLF
jgi:hypothetical protein